MEEESNDSAFLKNLNPSNQKQKSIFLQLYGLYKKQKEAAVCVNINLFIKKRIQQTFNNVVCGLSFVAAFA